AEPEGRKTVPGTRHDSALTGPVPIVDDELNVFDAVEVHARAVPHPKHVAAGERPTLKLKSLVLAYERLIRRRNRIGDVPFDRQAIGALDDARKQVCLNRLAHV